MCCCQEHQAVLVGWNAAAAKLRAGLASKLNCVVRIVGVGMTRKAMQADSRVLVELGCVPSVDVQPEASPPPGLKQVEIAYTLFSDVGLLPDWSWCCVKGLVLESELIGDGKLQVKLVNEIGMMLPLRLEGTVAENDFEEGSELSAVMVQVSQKYGNLTAKAETKITVVASEQPLPGKVQAVKFY